MNIIGIVSLAAKFSNQAMKIRINNAKYVSISSMKLSLAKAKLKNNIPIPKGSAGLLTVTREGKHPPRKHRQRVYPADDNYEGEKLFECDNIKISCDCEDWMFTWEFVQARKGNADMIYCNGQPPVLKNPRLYPGLCKHLIVIMSFIMKKRI